MMKNIYPSVAGSQTVTCVQADRFTSVGPWLRVWGRDGSDREL